MQLNKSFLLLICILFIALVGCKSNASSEQNNLHSDKILPKFSLAQWSFHKELKSGSMSTVDFIHEAASMGFEGVEYVNQFFADKAEDFDFLDSLNVATKQVGIKSLMIMLDNIGDLGDTDSSARHIAIENGKKWVIAAKYLGCASVRVNAHGNGTPEQLKANCVDGIGALAVFANSQGIEVIIENHGGPSSNGAWLADLLKRLEPYNVGSLPDFGNWCEERENGELWSAPCIKEYDGFQGLHDLMPYAKSLSVKSFDFDNAGNETTLDYKKLFSIIHSYKYNGYCGIEYEGERINAKEGIQKTMNLVKSVW